MGMMVLAAILGLCGVAQATLLVQEGFDYAPVAPVNGTQTGGVGFAVGSHWGSGANANIVGGLAYPGLLAAGTGAIRKTTGFVRIERALASSFGGSTFYVGMVINTYGQNDARCGIELRNGEGPCLGRVTGGWGFFGGANGKGGISNSGGSFQTWTGVTKPADSVPHLVVFKFDYAANAIKLFLDPLQNGIEPTPSATLQTGGNWTINLNSDVWTALALFSEQPNEAIDELRVGTTWADVAPATIIAPDIVEGFNYPLGAVNQTQTGGTGFATGSYWPTNTQADIVAGLTYPGLIATGTNALKKLNYGRLNRALAAPFGGRTYYIGMLINANGAADNRCGVERDASGPCFGQVAGGWGMFSASHGVLGVSNSVGTYQTWVGVAKTHDSLTHLLVYKIDYEANAIKLFVDPVPDAAEPAPSAVLQTGGNWTINLNANADLWNSFSLWSENANKSIDEVRFGASWEAVVPATVLTATVQEGFDYPAGPLDTTQSNGLGFAAATHWGYGATSNSFGSIVGGLTYPNLLPAGAGAIKSEGWSSSQRLTALYGGSTFYLSMLLNCNNQNTGRFGFDLRTADGPCFGRTRLDTWEGGTNGWGMFGPAIGVLGITGTSNAVPYDYPRWVPLTNTVDTATHLLVFKVDYAANNLKMYLDPTVDGAEPAPSATLATGGKWTVNLNNQTFDGIRFVHENANMIADELRIGKTWGAVVPPQVTTWIQPTGGVYRWVTSANWNGGTVPMPAAGATIDCSTVDLAGNVTLWLDAVRTLTTWRFGDTAGTQTWTVATGTAGSKLVLAGPLPGIQVNQNTATIAAAIDGTAGLNKTGAGTLVLMATNNVYTGPTTIGAGTLRLGINGAAPVGNSLVMAGGTLDVAAGITNAMGTLTVTADSVFALSAGTDLLTFAGDSTTNTWTGNLAVTGTLPERAPSAVKFYPYGLTGSQLRRITYAGRAVHLDANGYLLVMPIGTIVTIR
jgi:autotransporter-associated beta strand protein